MYQPWLASILIASAPLVALAQTPATQRSASSAVQTADKKVPPPPAGAAAKPDAKGVRTVEIIGTDDMKFSVQTIAAKPGEQIRVRLMSKGAMPKIAMAHNFVLLAKAADTLKFVNAAALARTTDFIPPEMKAQIIATQPSRARERRSKSRSRRRPLLATTRISARSLVTSRHKCGGR